MDDLKFGKYIAVINDITEFRKLQDEKRKIELKLWQEYRLASIGLGLTITYHNLKIYGAEFEIDSKVGEGTSFKVIIPKKNVGAK